MRVFFATDIHGSEVCWRKFLNAGKFHKADVLIMGGDMTGKAMVPIVANGSNWELELQGQHHVLTTEDELRAMEKRISDRGYYPIRLTRDEVDAWAADADARRRAVQGGDARQRRALDGARRRAAGGHRHPLHRVAGQRRHLRARPDHRARRASRAGRGRTRSRSMASPSSRPARPIPTPWNTYRELPEPELRERIDGLVAQVPDPHRAIFNFHAPPYGSNLDNAPKLDADMNYVSGGQALIPVGSHAVRESILAYGPPLSLHGHIHEGKGAVKLGSTLAVNPGSSYEDGVLQAAIVDLDAKKGTVKRYLLING